VPVGSGTPSSVSRSVHRVHCCGVACALRTGVP